MDAAAALPEAWSQVRAPVIVPLLRLAVAVCLTMSVLLFLERMYMAVVIAGVRLLRLRPERRYRCDPIPEDDPELGSAAFPSVLVQIPMFNEREVHPHCARPPLLAGASSNGGRRRDGFRLTLGGCCCRCTSCRSARCAGCRGRRTGWWCRCSTTPRTK